METKQQIIQSLEPERRKIYRQTWHMFLQERRHQCFCGAWMTNDHPDNCPQFRSVVESVAMKRYNKLLADRLQTRIQFPKS